MVEEFDEFAAAAWPRLIRAGRLLGLPQPDAEDLAQNTLATCFAKWRLVSRADDRFAYAYTIQLNRFRSDLRRRRLTLVPQEYAERVIATTVDPDLDLDLDAALATLPRDMREAVVLRFGCDLTERQTAAVLGCAVGTVKSRVSRALQKLRSQPELASYLSARNRVHLNLPTTDPVERRSS